MMTTFFAFFILEAKRLFSWRNWVIYGAIIILILSCFLVNLGIQQYNDMQNEKKEFRELERKKVEQISDYDRYGVYGFRLYFMPCPMSTLFYNSSHFTELTCRIDSGEKLNTYSLFKGKKVFEEKPGKLMDFSGIILILGSLLSLFYGYEAYSQKEYMKFLSSLYGQRRTFVFIWLSRVILLCLLFLIIALISHSLLFIHGIAIAPGLKHLFVFLALMLIMQVFFFSVGTIASSFESRLVGGLFIAVSWILSVYLFPALLNKRVEARVEKMPSDYQLELKKLEVLMPFEKETKALVEKTERQYGFLGKVYNKIKNEIKTKEGFWTLIGNLEKGDAISQDQREILNKLVNILKEKGDLDYEKIKKETYNLYLNVYNEGSQILSVRGRLYLEQELPRIQAKENELLNRMKSEVDFFQWLFSLYPTAFYLSTGNEIGSRGYENTIDFYEKAITLKNEFLQFYVQHRYEKKSEKIVSFIEKFKKKVESEKDSINLDTEFRKFYKLRKDGEKYKEKKKGVKRTYIYQFVSQLQLPGKFELEILFFLWQQFADIIKLYDDVIKINKEFWELYVILREGKDPGKIVNFIEVFKEKVEGEREANIFYAPSRLPGRFLWGGVIAGLWILSALLFSYLFYKKALFHRPRERIAGLGDLEIELKKGESNVVLSSGKTISQHLYNVLAGKNVRKRNRIWELMLKIIKAVSVDYHKELSDKYFKKRRGFWGKVFRDKINLAEKNEKIDFTYLFHPDFMPTDISPRAFIFFVGRASKMKKNTVKEVYNNLNLEEKKIEGKNFGELKEMGKDRERGQILLEAAGLTKSPIYMMDNFARGMPTNFVEKFVEGLGNLKGEGASILYLTNNVFIGQRIGEYISFLKQETGSMAVTV